MRYNCINAKAVRDNIAFVIQACAVMYAQIVRFNTACLREPAYLATVVVVNGVIITVTTTVRVITT